VEARAVALRARARAVGIDPAIPREILAMAATRVSDADHLLDGVQADLEQSEASVADRLREQLDELMASATGQPQVQAREAIERCLELRQFAVARALLESGDWDRSSAESACLAGYGCRGIDRRLSYWTGSAILQRHECPPVSMPAGCRQKTTPPPTLSWARSPD
jgi:hypothetical protein